MIKNTNWAYGEVLTVYVVSTLCILTRALSDLKTMLHHKMKYAQFSSRFHFFLIHCFFFVYC